MNPDYAGRVELPDNLKALLRPVSMVVPDMQFIAEISLFVEGFKEVNSLSKKIVECFKLASEQLSHQPHYHFGMRSIATALSIASSKQYLP
jgi:dynein heavy chain